MQKWFTSLLFRLWLTFRRNVHVHIQTLVWLSKLRNSARRPHITYHPFYRTQMCENGSVKTEVILTTNLHEHCNGSSLDIVRTALQSNVASLSTQTIHIFSYTTISTLTQTTTKSGPINILTNQYLISLHKICTLYVRTKMAQCLKKTKKIPVHLYLLFQLH